MFKISKNQRHIFITSLITQGDSNTNNVKFQGKYLKKQYF